MKTYVKPDVYYENFELSQHIASCDWDMVDLRTKEDCSASNMVLGTLFENINKCQSGTITEDMADVYCYTVQDEGFNIFNS